MRKGKGPEFTRFFQPILEFLQSRGGSCKSREVVDEVIRRLSISEEELAVANKNGGSRIKNQIHWARQYLVEYGGLDKAVRGIWTLTPKGMEMKISSHDDELAIFDFVTANKRKSPVEDFDNAPVEIDDVPETEGPVVVHMPVSYSVDNIISDGCFVSRDELLRYLSRLENKKNMILQGPPGTGKTWLAKRLAYALMGEKNTSRTTVVQFHPNLSYEDFIRGYRPDSRGSLVIEDGPFMKIIAAALQKPSEKFVLVIEEINRGNPAQTLGEMLTLMEVDKRTPDEAISLTYGDDRIYIPENLCIIGTMNVADRSLAMVDLALRRRFAFVDLIPRFDDVWKDWLKDCGVSLEMTRDIQHRMKQLNEAIAADAGLGEHFRIGHSFVTPPCKKLIEDVQLWFREIVATEIGPLLEEYWFDDRSRALELRDKLINGF